MRWRRRLDSAATVSVIAACASVVWLVISMRPAPPQPRTSPQAQGPSNQVPAQPLTLENAAILGDPGARTGVVQFSDFECPFCATFARETLPKVKAEYVDAGKAFVAFRHFPLESIHPNSVAAAETAECARRIGRFWEIHDTLFEQPRGTLQGELPKLLETPAMRDARVSECLAGDGRAAVRSDLTDARALGISGTPTFLFGALKDDGMFHVTRRESGAIPFTAFAALLEETIRKAR
jgi:protein-disulfide isomerase